MSPDPHEIRFLRRALELAAENADCGDGGPFGAVIVHNDQIIAEARNRVVVDNDPTAHAEVEALRAACKKLGQFHLEGCVLYASSEPCPMCLAAAYWARVARIVYANSRSEAAAAGFCDAELYQEFLLAPNDRRIPCRQLELPNARAPFEAWRISPHKRDY
ncbi:MAG: nucleoside deaminase [Zoogloeaceae bacterium]|jgi:tRNA(Arg) A34 adenosine deaminase TadA|nr:nucleoside deaminase [Zoogloeaceae bacterium]